MGPYLGIGLPGFQYTLAEYLVCVLVVENGVSYSFANNMVSHVGASRRCGPWMGNQPSFLVLDGIGSQTFVALPDPAAKNISSPWILIFVS